KSLRWKRPRPRRRLPKTPRPAQFDAAHMRAPRLKLPKPEGAHMSSTEPLVLYRNTTIRLRRGPIEEFARILRERVAAGRSFCCLVTDDRELRRLNRRFLGHDY